ncbi:MAG TPA: metal ABC transporter ATP-binding protein [Patescibacteria group bacterium]|nr:metal ABC transporter ATP-binding protein [Patescibacteria group bacterium]
MQSQHHKHEPEIIVKHLTVGYDGKVVLSDLTFDIPKRKITAIIGPNGSGKSTRMKAILGIIPFQKGSVTMSGHDVDKSYGKIGYVPQRFDIDQSFPITVKELLSLAQSGAIHKDRMKEVLGEVGLNPVTVSRMLIGALSGGQMQRVLIARAIMTDPDILFLDEPATGIDVAGEQSIFELLEHLQSEHDTTIVMISHEVNLVEKHVDNVVCLNRGLVCSGPPAKALSDKVMKELYGQHYDRHDHDH